MQFISEHSAANSLGGCLLLGQRNRGFWQQLHKLFLPLSRGCLIAVHVCPQVRKLGLQMCVVGPRVPFFSRQLRRRVPPRLRVCLISFHFWTLFRKLVRHVCAPCPSRATVTRARVARRACGGWGGGGACGRKALFPGPQCDTFSATVTQTRPSPVPRVVDFSPFLSTVSQTRFANGGCWTVGAAFLSTVTQTRPSLVSQVPDCSSFLNTVPQIRWAVVCSLARGTAVSGNSCTNSSFLRAAVA